MKTIQLKVFNEKVDNSQIVITTYGVLRNAATQPPPNGWEIEDMRKRMRILDKLDKFEEKYSYTGILLNAPEGYLEKTDSLDLEDSEFDNLKAAFLSMKWAFLSKAILEINDQIVAL